MENRNDPELLQDYLTELYRQEVSKRYDYVTLVKNQGLPETVTPELVELIRDYFLNDLYPPIDRRHLIDEAFSNLETYIGNPAKALQLTGGMTLAIFRFGTDFPAAVKAGFKTLESYLQAKKFEKKILESALKLNLKPPISESEYTQLLTSVPKKEMEKLIFSIEALLQSLTNISLMRKTISILGDMIENMEKKPATFSPEEVASIRTGVSILENGYELFRSMDRKLRELMVRVILETELNYLETIYEEE